MYAVTDEYKNQMRKTIRNKSYIKVVFGITDPDAPASSTPIDNGHLIYSDVNSIDAGISVSNPYATLEHNRCVLNGKLFLAEKVDPSYQGFVGYEICKEDKSWINEPQIVIKFAQQFQFAGMTFYFDSILNEFPDVIQIKFYKDNSLISTKYLNPTSPVFVLNEQIPLHNTQIITFKQMNKPFRRARLSGIIYGLVSELTEKDLTKCSYKASADILSTSLPEESFSFTIFDTEKKYDPENPQGVWEYLESRQPVKVSIGYELDSGTIEWMPLCNTWSTGDVKVGKGGAVTECTFETTTLLQQLTQTYTQGTYNASGKSLYDLAEDIMTFCGYPNILEMDESLKTLITTAPLQSQPANQLLQLIANAGMCNLVIKRTGAPAIIKMEDNLDTFKLGKESVFDRPKTTKYPILKELKTKYTEYFIDSELTDLISEVEITDAQNLQVEYTYSLSTNQKASVTGSLQVVSAVYYASSALLILKGTGTLTIKGYSIKTNDIDYIVKVHEVGEVLETSNELVNTKEWAQQYAQWVIDAMNRRIEYTASDRGFPELDIGDLITFISNFDNEVPVTVLSKELEYNGTIKGSGTYLAKEET